MNIFRKRASLVICALTAAVAGCATSFPRIPDAAAQDLMIIAAIKTALLNDRQVNGMSIDVETVGGVVTLSGVVPTGAGERRAIELARAVDGVVDVKSKLRIDGSRATPVQTEPGDIHEADVHSANPQYFVIPTCAAPSFGPNEPEDPLIVRPLMSRNSRQADHRSAEPAMRGDRCAHCGSVRTQEAFRTKQLVTVRCLHCWKLFTRTIRGERMLPTDDAA